MAKQYVVGLMFSPDKTKVVLIQKNRPEWQKGKLNGIGGKKEKEDFNLNYTMVREFKEETGVETKSEDWSKIITLTNQESETITFFKCFSDKWNSVHTITDEKVDSYNPLMIINTKMLRDDDRTIYVEPLIMDNIPWIIMLAFDKNISRAEAQSLI